MTKFEIRTYQANQLAIQFLKERGLKKSHWIKHDTGHSIYYECLSCGCLAPCTEMADSWIWKLSRYCPDCGAEMIDVNRMSNIVQIIFKDGVVLSEQEMTNGEVFKKLFPNVDKYDNMLLKNHSENILFDDSWWNSQYEEE